MRHAPLLLALSLISAGTYAQDSVYRGVDAQGRVVYSDSAQRVKNAKKIELAPAVAVESPKAPTPSAPDPQPAPTPAGAPTAAASASAARALAAQAKGEAQWDAQRALGEALRQQADGVEPLEGKRLGTAGGASRLAPAYFARQERLAKAVAQAQGALQASESP